MCGRYTIIDLSRFTDLFPWIRQPETPAPPRYNVCPSQEVPIVANTAEPKIDFAQWGLVPSWGSTSARPLINARAETLATKRTFKDALRKRRCLLPADGFYEWKTNPRSEEHTSELQSLAYLVCRLLLEKKKTQIVPLPYARSCRCVSRVPRSLFASLAPPLSRRLAAVARVSLQPPSRFAPALAYLPSPQ